MAALIRINRILSLRNILVSASNNSRMISTSQKKSETATVCPPKSTTSEAPTNKNWVSYGFDYKDEASDNASMKGSFFFSVTLCLVWGTFVWSYLPDTQLRDWAQREGYLELRKREQAGLEPISRDFIDPSKIELPSDEELLNTEIII